MAKPASLALDLLTQACYRLDMGLLQRALAAGADPNALLDRPALDARPLCAAIERAAQMPLSRARPFLDALIGAGAWLVPPASPRLPTARAHPLAFALSITKPDLVDYLLDQLTPAQAARLDIPVVLRAGQDPIASLDLLELALARGNTHAAERLWHLGLAPAGPCAWSRENGLPAATRDGALAHAATAANGHAPGRQEMFERVLTHGWDQASLDVALRQCLLGPLEVIEKLLAAGARPTRLPGDDADQAPLLARALYQDYESPAPGVVSALIAHGAPAHERIDLDLPRPESESTSNHLRISPSGSHPHPHVRAATLIHLAALQGHAHAIDDLAQAGLDPAAPSGSGHHPLFLACCGATTLVEPSAIAALLARGACPAALSPGLTDPGNPACITAVEAWIQGLDTDKDADQEEVRMAHRLLVATLQAAPARLPLIRRCLERFDPRKCHPVLDTWRQALEAFSRKARLHQALPHAPLAPGKARM